MRSIRMTCAARPPERFGGRQSAKAAANDHDYREMLAHIYEELAGRLLETRPVRAAPASELTLGSSRMPPRRRCPAWLTITVYRNPAHHLRKPAFAPEGLQEARGLQHGREMDGNSARQVHSSHRQHLERQVAGLASHDRNHRVDRGHASRAGRGRIERGFDDRFRAIAGRGDPLRGLGVSPASSPGRGKIRRRAGCRPRNRRARN